MQSRQVFRRAWLDTAERFIGGMVMALISAGFTFGLLHLQLGPQVAMGELQLWLYSAAGGVIGFTLLFLWNLACAPYRIERDAHATTKEQLRTAAPATSLAEFVAGRDVFTMKEAACIKAGSQITHGELTGPASGYLYDLKKMVLSGHISIVGINNPAMSASIQVLKMNFGRGLSLFSEQDMKALEDAEISKSDLVQSGFIKASQLPQSRPSTEKETPR